MCDFLSEYFQVRLNRTICRLRTVDSVGLNTAVQLKGLDTLSTATDVYQICFIRLVIYFEVSYFGDSIALYITLFYTHF